MHNPVLDPEQVDFPTTLISVSPPFYPWVTATLGEDGGSLKMDKATGQTFYSNYSMMHIKDKVDAPRSRT